MNPWTAFGVFLVGGFGVAGVAFTGGLFVAARLVQSDSSNERESVRVRPLPASSSSTSGSGTVYHPSREGDVDADSEALRRVQNSDEAEIRESPRGFRGRDLSDREVDAWLRRWRL